MSLPDPKAAANPYVRTKVMTASPQELRLMLLDGAMRFAATAREGLRARDYEKSYDGISRCQAVLIELINGLAPEHAPDLCRQLSALYTFMYRRLVDASRMRDPGIVDEVLELLRYERQTWQMLLDKLAADRAAEAQGPMPAPEEGQAPGKVGGKVSVKG